MRVLALTLIVFLCLLAFSSGEFLLSPSTPSASAYNYSVPDCTINRMLSWINSSDSSYGTCTYRSYNTGFPGCENKLGALALLNVYAADKMTSVPGFSQSGCTGPTTYSWSIISTGAGHNGSDGVSLVANLSDGGAMDLQVGEWDSFTVHGSCPGQASSLNACVTMKWNGVLGALSNTATSIAGSFFAAYKINYGKIGSSDNAGGAQLNCGKSTTNSFSCATADPLKFKGNHNFTADANFGAGTNITIVEFMEQTIGSLGGGTSSVSGSDPFNLTSSAPCTQIPPPMGVQCVWFTPIRPTLPSSAASTGKTSAFGGYGIQSPVSSTVTGIQVSFKQPKITCNPALASAQDVFLLAGIDGIGTGADFEVLGTLASCNVGSSTPSYSEYSSAAMTSPLAIVVGHVYSAVIAESAGTFTYTFTDVTAHKTSTGTSSNPAALLNAAECVVDRAQTGGSALPLANFGKVAFGMDTTHATNTCFATASGGTKAIGAFTSPLVLHKYVLYNVGLKIVDANPSSLTVDRSSFNVVWKAAGP